MSKIGLLAWLQVTESKEVLATKMTKIQKLSLHLRFPSALPGIQSGDRPHFEANHVLQGAAKVDDQCFLVVSNSVLGFSLVKKQV